MRPIFLNTVYKFTHTMEKRLAKFYILFILVNKRHIVNELEEALNLARDDPECV